MGSVSFWHIPIFADIVLILFGGNRFAAEHRTAGGDLAVFAGVPGWLSVRR
jgi:Sec-independent protein translocase protein TatA